MPYAALGGRKSAHLVSDQCGEAGTRELVTFATSIGLRRSWLQNGGTRREHFDVFGHKLGLCNELGVQVLDRRAFGAILRKKRKWEDDPDPFQLKGK